MGNTNDFLGAFADMFFQILLSIGQLFADMAIGFADNIVDLMANWGQKYLLVVVILIIGFLT